MKLALWMLAAITAMLMVIAAGAQASPPPPLRTAHPAKGNLPRMRRMMLRGCVWDNQYHRWVCPIPAP